MSRARRTAAVSALASLCLAGFATPAEAAGGSLVITAINRSGHGTSAQVWVVNTTSHRRYSFSSTKPRTLPNGHYGVVVAIAATGTQADGTQTIGSRTFTVNGHRVTLRFDARQGKRITITANTAHPYRIGYTSNVCIAGAYVGSITKSDGVEDYAIPTANRGIRFSATAEWSPAQSGPFYWAVGKPTYGIPARPGYSWAHASFAKLSVRVLKGTVREPDTTLTMLPWTSCSPSSDSFASFAAPRTVTAYVTAGQWVPSIVYSGGVTSVNGVPSYKAGKTYHLTFTRKS